MGSASARVWFKPLLLNVSQGYYLNVLHVRGSGVLSRHRHHGPVHAFTLRGSWRYLEHDWVAAAGDYAFEPAGETHTLVVPDEVPEMVTLFHVSAGYTYIDPYGVALGYEGIHQARGGESPLRVRGPRQGSHQKTGPMTKRATIDVEGVPISYLTAGERVPLVLLLHGTYWSRVWQPVLDGIAAAGLRPVAVDFPGFGRSGGKLSVAKASIPALAAWLVRFLDALNVKGSAMVAGHDIGGGVAQHLLVRGAIEVTPYGQKTETTEKPVI
jgi:quercetin dioxygenase-like cupin family protein